MARTATGALREVSMRERLTADEIYEAILAQNREPFQQLLADWLDAAPDTVSIKISGKKSPDRYMQGLTQAAKLAGVAGPDVDINLSGLAGLAVRLQRMSDSEFEQAKLEYERQRALPAAPTTTKGARKGKRESLRECV